MSLKANLKSHGNRFRRKPRSKATINKDGTIHRKSSTKIYLITISHRNKKKYIPKSELASKFLNLFHKVPSMLAHHFSYELGSTYSQLHLHAIITMRSSVRYSSLKWTDGYYTDWKSIKARDLPAAISYVNKTNKFEQEQAILTNWYRHNYAFICDVKDSQAELIMHKKASAF